MKQHKRQAAALEAARWFICLNEDRMPLQERARYLAWLKTSPVHVAEMLRVIHIHEALLRVIQRVGLQPTDAHSLRPRSASPGQR